MQIRKLMNMHGRNQASGELYVHSPSRGSAVISIQAAELSAFRRDVYTFRLAVHQTQPNYFAL